MRVRVCACVCVCVCVNKGWVGVLCLSEIAASYSRLQWIQSIRPAASTRPALYSCPSHSMRRIIIGENTSPHPHIHSMETYTLKNQWWQTARWILFQLSVLWLSLQMSTVFIMGPTLIEGWNLHPTPIKISHPSFSPHYNHANDISWTKHGSTHKNNSFGVLVELLMSPGRYTLHTGWVSHLIRRFTYQKLIEYN